MFKALKTRIGQIAIGAMALAAVSGVALAGSLATSPAAASAHTHAHIALYNGNAWAGVRVRPSGSIVNSFNTFGGGAPTITHAAGSGVYYIHFPGAPIKDGNSILVVTPDTPSADCTATNADYAGSSKGTVVAVETKDCTNVFADRGFHLVVFG